MIITSQFNPNITTGLERTTLDRLTERGVAKNDIDIIPCTWRS